MVASFIPEGKVTIAVAPDGSLAAIHEPARVTVIQLPAGQPVAELAIDPASVGAEIGWLMTPAGPRLLVVTRYAATASAKLVDPCGPGTLAELWLDAPARLLATVGPHALVVGPPGALGSAVLTISELNLALHPFMARAVPTAAGAAARQLVTAQTGAIEEWDPVMRTPKRRIKLPKPIGIEALGGSERVVWMMSRQAPARIEVFPLVNRGQPKHHELPEPIAGVSAHPRNDLLVCVGAELGRVYVVDLDGRGGTRSVPTPGIERADAAGLIVGRGLGVIVAQAQRPLVIAWFDGKQPPPRDVTGGGEVTPPIVTSDEPPEPLSPRRSSLYDDVDEAPPAEAKPALMPVPVAARPSQPVAAAPSWRDRVGLVSARAADTTGGGATSVGATGGGAIGGAVETSSWRDELARWARAQLAGGAEPAPRCAELDEVIAGAALSPSRYPALALLYGAHLVGESGVAPVELARVLARDWAEALGRGELAAKRVVTLRDSRVYLDRDIEASLDER